MSSGQEYIKQSSPTLVSMFATKKTNLKMSKFAAKSQHNEDSSSSVSDLRVDTATPKADID